MSSTDGPSGISRQLMPLANDQKRTMILPRPSLHALRILTRLLPVSCLVLIALTVVQAQVGEDPPDSAAFSSVEERRLQARIAEEQVNITGEKKALLLKEQQLQILQVSIDEKLEEMDKKLAEIRKERELLEKLLAKQRTEELKQIRQLSKIYENMAPARAAQAISNLDQQLAADLLAGMRSRAAAKILDNLSEPQARELSLIFLSRQKP